MRVYRSLQHRSHRQLQPISRPFPSCLPTPICACHEGRIRTSLPEPTKRSHGLRFLLVPLALVCISLQRAKGTIFSRSSFVPGFLRAELHSEKDVHPLKAPPPPGLPDQTPPVRSMGSSTSAWHRQRWWPGYGCAAAWRCSCPRGAQINVRAFLARCCSVFRGRVR